MESAGRPGTPYLCMTWRRELTGMAHQRQVRINHGVVDPLTPRERQHIVGRYNRTVLDGAFGRYKTDVAVIALDDLDLMGINDFNALLGLGGRHACLLAALLLLLLVVGPL